MHLTNAGGRPPEIGGVVPISFRNEDALVLKTGDTARE